MQSINVLPFCYRKSFLSKLNTVLSHPARSILLPVQLAMLKSTQNLCDCVVGYTLALWVNFEKPSDREVVYLSNGGHSLQSHGVAMLYDKGNMEFRFRKKNGQEVECMICVST